MEYIFLKANEARECTKIKSIQDCLEEISDRVYFSAQRGEFYCDISLQGVNKEMIKEIVKILRDAGYKVSRDYLLGFNYLTLEW